MHADWIRPDWPAPAGVQALSTTRVGGVSRGKYGSLNLGQHVGDDAAAVSENRRRLMTGAGLKQEPRWLKQVHGVAVARLDGGPLTGPADAAVTATRGEACVVMTADCLPVLFCDRAGRHVAAAHAGWRGLAAGVLEATLKAMPVPADELLVWFGPAIGPQAYEVGGEVRQAFVAQDPAAANAFKPSGGEGKWHCDLYMLARQRLLASGLRRFHGGDLCTYTDSGRFFSFRRDGECGRMATLIWLG